MPRKPKPAVVHILNGNPSIKAKRDLVDLAVIESDPPKPKWLGPVALEQWDMVIGQLRQLGILSQTDSAIIAGYCQTYQRWNDAEADIKDNGITIESAQGIKKNPAVTVAEWCILTLTKLAGELSFSPMARCKVKPIDQHTDKKKETFFK